MRREERGRRRSGEAEKREDEGDQVRQRRERTKEIR